MNTKPKTRTAYFGIKLEPYLKTAVEDRARKEGVTPSVLIRIALRAFLDPKMSRFINANGKRVIAE